MALVGQPRSWILSRMSKRKRQSKGPFVAVPKAITTTPAWRAMSAEGRLLWIELRGWLRNDGLNNGNVLRSCRAAAKSLGFDKKTIASRYAENEHYGFLRKTSPGFLGADGRGIAAKYRFTDLAHGTHPPTRDFEKWERSLFKTPPKKPGWKKQSPVPQRGTYGRPPVRVPYVPQRGTYTRPRTVPQRGTYLDCHSPRQGKQHYGVAQQ